MVAPTTQSVSRSQAREVRIRRTAELFSQVATAEPDERDKLLHEIVVLNRPVADSIAARYFGRGIAPDDIRQTAYEGLVKAVQRFDCSKERDLLSFAVPTIRGEIRRYFRDHGWTVRPPRRIQELQQRIGRVTEQLGQDLGHEPRTSDMLRELDVDRADFEAAVEAYGCFQPTSLDQPQSREDGRTIGDLVTAVDTEEAASEARLTLEPVVRELPERDKRILYLRFYEDRTQEEIGRELGVTQMQVSRLLTRIYARLRDGIEQGPEAVSTP